MAICLDKMKQHGLSTYSNEFVTGNGTYTYEINLMKKDDAPIGYMVTITDITKKKELETRVMEMDKLAYMGTLGAGMAHELRNPLASLYGSIELLNEKSFNDKDKKLYSLILKESERLNKIVSDFLDFVKGENIEQTFIDLRQVVSETLTMINILTEKKIVTDIKINTIYGDSNLLIQTLNNLIWNALEAVDEDGTVTIRALRKGKNDIIEVSDNGSGIPKEELENIFTPFYSMKKSGAGLGLAIVKKNVITMGGKIEVQSDINKGTTFRVVLPSNNERD